MMKRSHFLRSSLLAVEHPELGSEVVVLDETVHHLHPLGLHGVLLAELVPSDVLVVQIAHLTHQLNNITSIDTCTAHQSLELQQLSNYKMINIYLPLLLVALALCRDNTNPTGFVTKLFDFSYPPEGIYDISLSGNFQQTNNYVKAYGDFNSDLRADYVAVDNQSNTLVFIYSKSSNLYELTYNYSIFQGCNPISYYLYDANDDGSLDITVWGTNPNSCMYLLLQTNSGFANASASPFSFATTTTQPSLFEYNLPAGGSRIKTECLLIYNLDPGVNSRNIFYFSEGKYINLTWSSIFSDNQSSVPFSDQHWNTFIDLTNDCFPDFVITNAQGIQFWIYNNNYSFYLEYINTTAIASLNLVDLNYDGSLDLIIAQQTQVLIYPGTKPLTVQSQFCVSGSYSFGFDWLNPIKITLPAGQLLIEQNLQFADLNNNGYPEMVLLVNKGTNNQVSIYQNEFENGGTFSIYSSPYQSYFDSNVNSQNILSVSFFDVLDNGVVDIIVRIKNNTDTYSLTYYNNYLYQNYFYIKGYGTNGKTTNKGAQVVGMSFYWSNSVGNSQKISYCSQISQTAYNAYPMPYVLIGLGRANNYVQVFTAGRLGDHSSWSPIIPNSQLAIFTGNQPSSNWNIKIFIMPADSLVYVVIVTIVILTILGLILVGIKCSKKRAEAMPLLADI